MLNIVINRTIRLIHFFRHPRISSENFIINNPQWFGLISDKMFMDRVCTYRLPYKINWDCPKTFNEKLQWLKLYNRKPLYTTLVDKYAVKKIVTDRIGEEYIIPTLGVWNNFDEIEFDKLPNQFVLKCTHDSGGLVICKSKKALDFAKAKEKINNSLKTDYYKLGREWPYKDVPRRIIAEQYMEDIKTKELRDYKFFCFDGVPFIVQVDFGRFTSHRRNIYDCDWNLLDLAIQYPTDHSVKLDKPKTLCKMIEIARVLSKDLPFARIDLYEVNGRTYFGEITLYHGNGLETFTPKEWDRRLGDMLELPTKRR